MFYKSSCIICRYALNTVVHYPHDKKVVDLKFRPHGDDLDVVHSVVTSSVDGKFKTWTLVDDTDIYSKLKPCSDNLQFYKSTIVGLFRNSLFIQYSIFKIKLNSSLNTYTVN